MPRLDTGNVGSGGGGGAGHNCDAPVTVTVGGTNIPIIDDGVTVHERKGGPLSMSKRAEVTFPLSDGETEWVNKIDAFTEGGTMQTASVSMEALDINGRKTGTETTLLNGYVSAVGASEGENQGHLTILGPYNLLNDIFASQNFDSRNTLEDVLSWMAQTFQEEQPIFDNVSYSTDGSVGRISNLTTRHRVTRLKKFSPNRDTLADVGKWLTEQVDARIWFEPDDGGGATLMAATDPGEFYDATDDQEEGNRPAFQSEIGGGDDVIIIGNNALYEMKPGNALLLRGESDYVVDLPAVGEIDLWVDSGSYVEAKAVYPPLVERAGGEIVAAGTSRKNTESNVEADARARLKKRLDDTSGGTMQVALAPFLKPFDKITAYPGCKGILDKNLNALEYEVERTAHTLAPKPDDGDMGIPKTEVAVSMSIDPLKIESETTTKSTAPTGEEGEGKDIPKEEGLLPWSDFDWNIYENL